MVDIPLLKRCMDESGMTIKTIAERSNIPRYTLDRRLNGEGDFTSDEIVGLTRTLRLKKALRDKIFLL